MGCEWRRSRAAGISERVHTCGPKAMKSAGGQRQLCWPLVSSGESGQVCLQMRSLGAIVTPAVWLLLAAPASPLRSWPSLCELALPAGVG